MLHDVALWDQQSGWYDRKLSTQILEVLNTPSVLKMAAHTDKADGVHLEYSNTPAIDDNLTLEKIDTSDTVHNDEAVTVLAHYDGNQEWTKDEERKLVRKIDRRLLVILTISFGVQFYDKYMLSHAVGKRTRFTRETWLTILGHLWTD